MIMFHILLFNHYLRAVSSVGASPVMAKAGAVWRGIFKLVLRAF